MKASVAGVSDDTRGRRLAGLLTGALCFGAALLVFLWRIGEPFAWTDEGVTYETLRTRSWDQLLLLWDGTDAPLLPYYLVAKLWVDLLPGEVTIGAIRSLSAVLAAVAVLFVHLLVSRHHGRVAGVVAAGMLVPLPGMSRYAQEARPAALLLAVTAVAWWSFDRWNSPADERRPSPAYAVVLCASLLAIPAASLFGLLQWGAMGIAALWCVALPSRHGWFVARVRLLVPMAVAAAVAVLPVVHIASHGTGPVQVQSPTVELLVDTAQRVASGAREADATTWLLLALIAASLISLFTPAMRRFLGTAWIWLLVPLVGGVVAGIVHAQFIRVRYWMPLILPAAALAAVGATQLGLLVARVLPRALRSAVRTLVAATLVVAVAYLGAPTHVAIRDVEGHDNPIVELLAFVDDLRAEHPEAVVLIDGTGASYYLAQADPELFAANILTAPAPDSENVWRDVKTWKERRAELADASSAIWIHFTPSTPRKTYAPLRDQLKEAGLTRTEAGSFHGRWRVTLWER